MKNRRTSKRKAGRFLFSNMGGLLALAAIIFDAGGLKEKVNILTSAQAQSTIVMTHVSNSVNELKTDVAVLKHRVGMAVK